MKNGRNDDIGSLGHEAKFTLFDEKKHTKFGS